jgi:hypothetical protein
MSQTYSSWLATGERASNDTRHFVTWVKGFQYAHARTWRPHWSLLTSCRDLHPPSPLNTTDDPLDGGLRVASI